MAITSYATVEGRDLTDLAAAVAEAIGAGKQPFGPPFQISAEPYPRRYAQVVIEGTPPGTMEPANIADIVGLQAALDGKLAPSDLITAAGGLMEGETIDPALIA